jgi:hypothetical protein
MDRFSNPFEGFSVPSLGKSSLEPHFERQKEPHAGSFAPKCGPSRLLAQEKKGLKFQIARCKTFGINQCKVRRKLGP